MKCGIFVPKLISICMKKHFLLSTILSVFTFLSVNAQVSFTADVTSGCGPLTVNFTNTTSDPNAVNWDWSFGDGTSNSSVHSPSHTYNTPGYVTVWLNAYDSFGGWIGDYNVNIDILGGPQNFNFQNDSVCPNDEVNFYLYGSGDSWEWNFGDGISFTENSTYGGANHTYSTPGNYAVSVDVTNSCGTFTVDTSIVVHNNVPFGNTPYMYVSVDSVCPNSEVYMDAEFGFSSYNWNFGDGGSYFGNNATYSYSALGTYTISVDITNGCGLSTTVTDNIVVHNNVLVTGGNIWQTDTVCPGQEFTIQGGSNNGTSYTWDFGDGNPTVDGSYQYYTYSTVGVYPVTLTITNDCGNTEVMNTQVVVSNNAQITDAYFQLSSTSLCPGDMLDFWVSSEYDYYVDFGDGTGTNDDWNHVYNNIGTYPVSVTYQNACGNSLTMYDTIYVQDNLPFTGNPYAGINQNPICVNGVADLYAQSGYASYSWDFGDGGTSTNRDAEHIYNAAGNYNAMVEITNECRATS